MAVSRSSTQFVTDMLTREEKNAIAALKRVAAIWPKTLMLVHSGCGGRKLYVRRIDPNIDDLDELETVDTIEGFNADSSA